MGAGSSSPKDISAEVEREVTLGEASRRLDECLSGLGLSRDMRFLGETSTCSAWSCLLRAHDGTNSAEGEGLGKGSPEEARLGAAFEALEHHLTGPDFLDCDLISLQSVEQLLDGPLGGDALRLPLENTSGELACHTYASLGGGPAAAIPVAFQCPWFLEPAHEHLRELCNDAYDYRSFMRYSCNSGSAIGVSRTEALVHALNETIERDAFSMFLVQAFLADGYSPTLVDPQSLPARLRAASVDVERLTGEKLRLIDITTDLGVPTVLAYVPSARGGQYRRGLGCSLHPEYAVWRAVSELVQATFYRPTDGDRDVLAGLAAYPVLRDCAAFDLEPVLAHSQSGPLQHAMLARLRPVDHLQLLVERLARASFEPFYRVAGHMDGGVTAVQTVIPGLERFFLVCEGNLVLPGSRGSSLASGAR